MSYSQTVCGVQRTLGDTDGFESKITARGKSKICSLCKVAPINSCYKCCVGSSLILTLVLSD